MPYNKNDPEAVERNRKYQHEWYKKHHHVHIERNRVCRENRRRIGRKYAQERKNVPCKDCGKEYPYYVMDFDHLKDKNFNISRRLDLNLKNLKREIEKCDVVCANCHRIRTYKRKLGY